MLAVATIFKHGPEIGKVTAAADWDDAIRIGSERISKLRGFPLSAEEIEEFTENQYFQFNSTGTTLEVAVQIVEIE